MITWLLTTGSFCLPFLYDVLINPTALEAVTFSVLVLSWLSVFIFFLDVIESEDNQGDKPNLVHQDLKIKKEMLYI